MVIIFYSDNIQVEEVDKFFVKSQSFSLHQHCNLQCWTSVCIVPLLVFTDHLVYRCQNVHQVYAFYMELKRLKRERFFPFFYLEVSRMGLLSFDRKPWEVWSLYTDRWTHKICINILKCTSKPIILSKIRLLISNAAFKFWVAPGTSCQEMFYYHIFLYKIRSFSLKLHREKVQIAIF